MERKKSNWSIGVTGPAGAGKSTLIDQLIRKYRKQNKTVAVIAVDPSSPFSGGAVLGDRVRMHKHYEDPGVYIRSVGSRGKTGGVSFSTRALLDVMSVYGTDVVILETVGAGQSEVDVMNLVDTTLVVLTPEGGDSIQALKAGMLEIASIFVINKKDRAGSELMAHEVQTMLSLSAHIQSWKPPVLMTMAQTGEGLDELLVQIQKHAEHLSMNPQPKEATRKLLAAVSEIIQTRVVKEVMEFCSTDPDLQKSIQENPHTQNPYQIAQSCFSSFDQKRFTRAKASKGK
ncbi:MAG: methylmalonyl Co-A mutase-associated GTPase MeaB [Bdellovibrionota bacterium]